MLILMSLDNSLSVKGWLVNWQPWSLLKIAGLPFSNALSNASRQKPTSRLTETSQDRTYRLYQSRTATSYTKPLDIRM